MTNNPVLKMAVMCKGYVFQEWQARSLEHLLQCQEVDIHLLILEKPVPNTTQSFFYRVARYPFSKLAFRLYYRFFFAPAFFKLRNMQAWLEHVPVIYPDIQKKGRLGECFDNASIQEIKKQKTDLILKFGFGILQGEILTATPLGIWSFHHGDSEKYRGVPPGFWEIVKLDPRSGITFQQLNEKLDAGRILQRSFVATHNHSWKTNLDQLLLESTQMPLRAIKEFLYNKRAITDFHPPHKPGKLYRVPGNLSMLRFGLRLLQNKIRFHLQKLFQPEHWAIAIIRKDFACLLEKESNQFHETELHWLTSASPAVYYADAFGIPHPDGMALFFEEYHYKTQKGHIASCIYNEKAGRFEKISPVLQDMSHYSFPFIFQDPSEGWLSDKTLQSSRTPFPGKALESSMDGSFFNSTQNAKSEAINPEGIPFFFMLPENAQNKAIPLLAYNPANKTWDLIKKLLPDQEVVDPAMLFHQGLYWLFFTTKAASNHQLHIWYSPDFRHEAFKPHLLNPVKTDPEGARMAGCFFRANGKIFRPAQDCSRNYGAKIIVYEITALSRTQYQEKKITEIRPPSGKKFNKGLHTISQCGDYLIFDAKNHLFNNENFLNTLRSYWKTLLAKANTLHNPKQA